MKDLEKFKIICKKCGKEAEVETTESRYWEDTGESPAHIEIKCECGEKEDIYL